MKSPNIVTALAAICVCTGCQNLMQPSRGYTDLAQSQIKSTDSISKSIQSLELSVTQNKKESEDRISKLENEASLRQQALNDAVTKINTANQKYESLVTALAGAASKTFTGTDVGSSAVSAFFHAVEGDANTAVANQAVATDAKISDVKTTATTAATSAKSQAVDDIKSQFPLLAAQNGVGPEKIQQLQSKTDQLSSKTNTDTT